MKKNVLSIFLILISSLLMVQSTGCTAGEDVSAMPEPTEVVTAQGKKSPTAFGPLEPTDTPVPTPTLRPSMTPLPTNTPIPTATPLPESHFITNITGHRQHYAISCEASAAADWAIFFGVQVYESDIQFKLPISDNPDKGFVGDVNDPWGQVPPFSYGVHAEPIAKVLRYDYDLPARAVKNFTLDELKKEIANGRPVIVWVIGNVVGGIPAEFTDKEGDTTIVAAYEHTVIVTGYNADRIRYMNNGKFYQTPTDVFLNSWGVLGNMAVYYHAGY